MNRWLALILLLGGINLFTACNSSNRKEDKNKTTGVFREPPFDSITDSINSFPGNATLYLRRAGLLSQKNLPELAHEDYKKAWSLKPDEATAVSYTASLFMTGRESEAITLLQECMTKFPGNSEFPRRLSEA